MSAWDRLRDAYRKLCEHIGRRSKLSPRNRRVRDLADRMIAEKRAQVRVQGARP